MSLSQFDLAQEGLRQRKKGQEPSMRPEAVDHRAREASLLGNGMMREMLTQQNGSLGHVDDDGFSFLDRKKKEPTNKLKAQMKINPSKGKVTPSLNLIHSGMASPTLDEPKSRQERRRDEKAKAKQKREDAKKPQSPWSTDVGFGEYTHVQKGKGTLDKDGLTGSLIEKDKASLLRMGVGYDGIDEDTDSGFFCGLDVFLGQLIGTAKASGTVGVGEDFWGGTGPQGPDPSMFPIPRGGTRTDGLLPPEEGGSLMDLLSGDGSMGVKANLASAKLDMGYQTTVGGQKLAMGLKTKASFGAELDTEEPGCFGSLGPSLSLMPYATLSLDEAKKKKKKEKTD